MLADLGDTPPKVILIGTGSEVSLCVSAAEQLAADGIAARAVSMPSWELFEQQLFATPLLGAAIGGAAGALGGAVTSGHAINLGRPIWR